MKRYAGVALAAMFIVLSGYAGAMAGSGCCKSAKCECGSAKCCEKGVCACKGGCCVKGSCACGSAQSGQQCGCNKK
jgi:hypothetical protein